MILIIDNYDSFTYNLYQMVATKGNVQVIRNDVMTPEGILRLNPAGIIISPGPGRPEDAGICIELIQRVSGKVPLLGVCLGCQAIATAFGGSVVLAPVCVHGKSEMIFHTRQGLFSKMPLPFQAGRYHSLVADKEKLPRELVLDAETADGLPMAIRHINHPIFGVQFHPESILTPMGERVIGAFLSLCKEPAEAKC